MTPTGNNILPEIKFRWCRTVRCRVQEVWLVLTSVTGTRVSLTLHQDLGWYEAPPTPIPCGLHTGFILIQDKVRDAITGKLRTRERDYKVDPFHIVPHKFAVELFLQSDQTSPFWSDVPELRLRYLSSDHLERLATSTHHDSLTDHQSGRLTGRKWVSSTTLSCTGDPVRREVTSSSTSKVIIDSNVERRAHPGELTRGRSHSQLRAPSTSFDNLKYQREASVSSPNLSRAFQVAVDLSRASSKFLAGLSSTSSGVCLGFEDGSEPPSPDTKDSANINSPYAAGGETSQDSEDTGGARRKKSLYSSRDRSLHIEDLTGEETWRGRGRRPKELDESNASSTSYEDLLASISSTRRATFKTELNILRFDTLAQERLVKEILAPSDSDFEDEEGACEASDSDLVGPYGCVITFESRSSSMDDVGSPRALEDVLVSLTSNESHPEVTFEPSQSQPDFSSAIEHDSESNLETPSSSERRQPQPKSRTITPVSRSETSSLDSKTSLSVPLRMNTSPVSEFVMSVVACDSELDPPSDGDPPHDENRMDDDVHMSDIEASDSDAEHDGATEGNGLIPSVMATRGPPLTPDIEDYNFQYDSLKHEDEHLPIDIRNIDSEESLEPVVSKPYGAYDADEEEEEEEPCCRPDTGANESEGSGLYEVEGAQPTYSSVDGEVPSDSLTQVTTSSQKVTVRDVQDVHFSESDKKSPVEERECVSDTNGKGKVSSEEFDVPKRNEKTEEITVEDLLDDSDLVSAVIKTKVTFSGSKTGGPLCDVVGEGERSYERGDLGRTLVDGDRGRTSRGGNEGKTFTVSDRGRSVSDVEGESLAVGDRGRTLMGHNEVRTDTRIGGRAKASDGFKSEHDRENNKQRQLRTPAGGSRERQLPATRGTNPQHLDQRDSENLQPLPRPLRLQNAGTQTPQTKRTSKMTSTRSHKFSEGEGAATSTTKYSRSPLRNRTNGQAESPYTPLPDRLSGPWSQRVNRGPTAPPPPPAGKPELATLQRNLYSLVQAHEAGQVGQNSLLLRHLQSELRQPRGYHLPHGLHLAQHILPSASPHLPPPVHNTRHHRYHHHHHQSPVKHHHQSSFHNRHYQSTIHHHQPAVHRHHSPVHHHSPVLHHDHQSPAHHSTPPFLHKYPVLNSTLVQSSSSMAYYNTRPNPTSHNPGDRLGGVSYGGSAGDLGRLQHTATFSHHTVSGASSIRSASSLPDLYHTAPAGHQGPARTTTFTLSNPGPSHAHSAFDVMVGRQGWTIQKTTQTAETEDTLTPRWIQFLER
ncbi:uncharacterized protein LOC121860414 isoform X2 [Homarus americanus]|uniref:uncharacterized protein LOC121860414 isoform X2 n=1 Tax=Homarus americanus TaxID=6706 RepID=UPI001C479334|nr:uncharacterized protein LOC121860414 isoform X2 [Homarus americanus]